MDSGDERAPAGGAGEGGTPVFRAANADRWRRTYWVVWIANLVTSIGMMSFLPFFPSLLEEMGVADEGRRSVWAGVCFAAAPLSATISAPIWGAVGDRFGRKVMVCRAMAAIALFVGSMGFATSPWQLLALRLGQGMFSGFIPPSITLVSIAAPEDRQGRVAGNLGTALAIGGLVGPLLGGLLANALGSRQSVFFVVASLATVSAFIVWFGAEEDRGLRRTGGAPSSGKPVRDAFERLLSDLAEVFSQPAMRAMALVVFSLQFGLGSVNPILELHVQGLFEGDLRGTFWARVVGLLGAGEGDLEQQVETFTTALSFGVMAVANLVSLPIWGAWGDRVGHARALARCGGIAALALVIQAATPSYGVFLAGRFLMGVGMAGIGPLAFGLAAGQARADRRGGAFGVVFSARTLAVAVGGTSGGLLYTLLGARGLMLLAALLVVGTLVGFRRSSAARAAATSG